MKLFTSINLKSKLAFQMSDLLVSLLFLKHNVIGCFYFCSHFKISYNMILPFKTKWSDGTPTYFVPKIWHSLELSKPFKDYPASYHHHKYCNSYCYKFKNRTDTWGHLSICEFAPKIHTIRKGNRWKAGNKIHFSINPRSKDYFQFAPVVDCISVQDIEIIYKDLSVEILINGEHFGEIFIIGFDFLGQIDELIKNDGFENVEEFLKFFNKPFQGQIIHWTKLVY